MLWVGVDIGGTFTDVVCYDPETRRLASAKSLSTPDEPVRAVLQGLDKLDVPFARIARFVHGTTRVTNALLEHSGAAIALITTRGFRDVVEMARGHRPRLYSPKEQTPPRLVERVHRYEVTERLLADGTMHVELDEAEVVDVLGRIAASGVSGVAICFLHSYANRVHEDRVACLIDERHPGLFYSTSAEVVPELGEYERFATTALNVSVKPLVDRYLSVFEGALAERGYLGGLLVMTSSGGIVSADTARKVPMQLALSGPAGGVAASAHVAAAAGFPDVITCDVGGTSADVCLIRGGQPAMAAGGHVGGYPNKTFQVEINTIGAGGGSVAFVDIGGELCVGPRSAGSSPGPACYGLGGTEPTTTDAHLVVGHLDPDEPLGGEVRPNLQAARRAMLALSARLGGGLDVERLALGIIQLAVAKMTSAIKEISVARGHDPRDFALLPFGGAGPMHATALAEELGMRTILVPPVPGNLSALGFVTARARQDLVATMRLDGGRAALVAVAAAMARLEAEGVRRIGLPADAVTLQRSIGVRIKGQSFDLAVSVASVPTEPDALHAAFAAAYEARYAYLPAAKGIEIVNCRLTALGPVPDVNMAARGAGQGSAPGRRPIYTASGWTEAAIVARAGLRAGDGVGGPAIITESGATTVVGAGWTATVDRLGNLVVTRDA